MVLRRAACQEVVRVTACGGSPFAIGPVATENLAPTVRCLPNAVGAGWAIHFVIGSVIMGPLFAVLYARLPTKTPETKGILFAVAAWVAMMLIISMMGDPRTFSGSAGFGTFGWMLITHMIFGGVMGNVFARLLAREKRAAGFIHGAPAH